MSGGNEHTRIQVLVDHMQQMRDEALDLSAVPEPVIEVEIRLSKDTQEASPGVVSLLILCYQSSCERKLRSYHV